MRSNTFTISDLFSSNRRYIVPLFQRPYVWDRDRQWKPLWEDIIDKTNQILDRTRDSRYTRSHFMGAVVINQLPTFGRQVPAMEVIDGQQRITTLQILFVALRDFAKKTAANDITFTLTQLTENNMLREQEVERYKVWPTTTDRKLFEDVFKAGSPEALESIYPLVRIKYSKRFHPRPKLVEAYMYFYKAISDYTQVVEPEGEPEQPELEEVEELIAPELTAVHTTLGDGDQKLTVDTERLYAIMQVLTKHLELVVIELEDRDDPQVIFETLNARGEPLLPSDLIRNFVFLRAAQDSERVAALYNTYWQSLDQPDPVYGSIWKQETRQGRLVRPLIDLFFFHYLTYRTGREMLLGHVFQEYRTWWKEASPAVEDELAAIQRLSEVFKSFFVTRAPGRLGVFARRLRQLDTSTFYPLLLLLGDSERHIDPQERDGILTDLESYLIRRLVCGLTNKAYNRTMLSILNLLRTTPIVKRATVQRFLLDLQGDTVRWPTDEEFERAWMTLPAYKVLGPGRTLMFLEALDLQLTTKLQEQVHLSGPLNIEHVMPQHGTEADWPLPGDPADEEHRKRAHEQREQIMHTFGNLTLLSQALNITVSNGPFAQKCPAITANSSLRLNAYFQHFLDGKPWTEDAIEERGRELFQVARLVWPRP